MNVPIPQLLARLGAMPPFRFVLLFAGLQAACTVLLVEAVGDARVGAASAAVWGLRVGVLLVFTVAAFHRDDDPLECGLLAAGVLLISGAAAQAVIASIAERTPLAGFVQLVFAPLSLIPAAILYVPLCAALVWVARRADRVVRTVRIPPRG